MKPSDIAQAYDQITHLWQDQEFDLNNGIEQHKIALRFANNKGKALDIGCGCTGRFIDLLLDQGFQASGLDISTNMLDLARQRHPTIEFIQADICTYPLIDQYDFITAWDSLWHIPLEQQIPVMSKIISSLSSAGVFIFSFGGIESAGSQTDDYMGPSISYSSLGTSGFLNLCLELDCRIRHLEFDQHPHAYLIVEKI